MLRYSLLVYLCVGRSLVSSCAWPRCTSSLWVWRRCSSSFFSSLFCYHLLLLCHLVSSLIIVLLSPSLLFFHDVIIIASSFVIIFHNRYCFIPSFHSSFIFFYHCFISSITSVLSSRITVVFSILFLSLFLSPVFHLSPVIIVGGSLLEGHCYTSSITVDIPLRAIPVHRKGRTVEERVSVKYMYLKNSYCR